MHSAEQIIYFMLNNDAFSRWLDIKVESVSPGQCKLSMIIRDNMTNGFHIAHGGIVYSLADSALAFAANAHGKIAKTIQLNCQYIHPIQAGQIVVAEAIEASRSKKFAYYIIHITSDNQPLAMLQGMAYISEKPWAISAASGS